MAVAFRVNAELVELTVAGVVTTDDVLAQLGVALRHPDTVVPVRLLIDVTASELIPDQEGLRRIARLIASEFEGTSGGVAVLVAEKLRYGLARQIGAFLQGAGIVARPFWERAEALTWLANLDET